MITSKKNREEARMRQGIFNKINESLEKMKKEK